MPDSLAGALAKAATEDLRGSCLSTTAPPPQSRQQVEAARRDYPRRHVPKRADPFDGSSVEQSTPRRIMGFGLGFEKIFATTSLKLPGTATLLYAEMVTPHDGKASSRCFNGLDTVFDLKKWVFEQLQIPASAYTLTYAEPGKIGLEDEMRLLTTQDSLDTRTFATTRAMHFTQAQMAVSGLHSIGDIGVTRLYVRLRCRACGELKTPCQTCQKKKAFGHIQPKPEEDVAAAPAAIGGGSAANKIQGSSNPSGRRMSASLKGAANAVQQVATTTAGVPGLDPQIEDRWHRPDECKNCLYHARGYDMHLGARARGGSGELARIFLSVDQDRLPRSSTWELSRCQRGGHLE
ncbi:unnamed protein product [Prorocentrum cordatum]|uniref:Ubiquitinyl hydrolase 1 n=1 Tax=Prorocentrum cordatum TaxID=2364126 RepID=A0ABN9TE04_9DINO|nr:unnamed protein product [Polarella glacialis]